MKFYVVLLVLSLLISHYVHANKNSVNKVIDKKNIVVFVHGAWGGAWDYKNMASILNKNGYVVYRPTLTGLGERAHLIRPDVNLDTHIQDIVNVLSYEDLNNIVLVGHSYGGMVISGVANRVPERIAHLVYADAFVPLDGESALDLMPDKKDMLINLAKTEGEGWKIPPFWPDWGKDVPHPLESFRQPISLNLEKTKNIPATYILTIDPGAKTDVFSPSAERAKKRGWMYHEFQTGHNLQRTIPSEFADILMSIQTSKR